MSGISRPTTRQTKHPPQQVRQCHESTASLSKCLRCSAGPGQRLSDDVTRWLLQHPWAFIHRAMSWSTASKCSEAIWRDGNWSTGRILMIILGKVSIMSDTNYAVLEFQYSLWFSFSISFSWTWNKGLFIEIRWFASPCNLRACGEPDQLKFYWSSEIIPEFFIRHWQLYGQIQFLFFFFFAGTYIKLLF